MKLTDNEIYDLLVISNRYAKSRNNHQQPKYTFNQTINILNRWENQKEKIETAKKILYEISIDTYFINNDINNSSVTVGIEDSLRKTYVDYAQKLGNIIDPKTEDKDVQDQIKRIKKEIGQEKELVK